MSLSTLHRPETGRAPSTDETGFTSKLTAPRDRFLAAVVDHALSGGRRSAKDFMRSFTARHIMNALRDQPRLRAKLLVSTTGLNEKVALRKTASSAGEDLEIAIAERVTEEDDVVALFDPDDRVRYLDNEKLWAFVAEGEFWRVSAEGTNVTAARDHIAFILARARAEKLIADRDFIDGIGLDVLVESLPKQDLGRVLEKAIAEGRAGRVFKEERVLDVLTPQLLVEHVPLAHLWERLVASKLAIGRASAPDGASMPAPVGSSVPSVVSPPTSSIPLPSSVSSAPAPSSSSSGANTPVPSSVAIASSDDAPVSLDLNLNVEEGEPIIIDDAGDNPLSGVEVDVMLAQVGDSEAPPKKPDEALKTDVSKENGAADRSSSRPSNPLAQ